MGENTTAGKEEFEEDRRRWNMLTVGGVPVLRATQPLLVERPKQFLRMVHQALGGKPAH